MAANGRHFRGRQSPVQHTKTMRSSTKRGNNRPSEISTALSDEDWEKASVAAHLDPRQARQWSVRHGFFDGIKDSSVLPLHEVVMRNAPLETVLAILRAYPQATGSRESSFGRLPLHCACRQNVKLEVVRMLLEENNGACLIPDNLGRLPIHYALSNGAGADVVSLLLHVQPNAARGYDEMGWTPLHVACSVGAPPEIIQTVLTAFPDAIVMKTSKGNTPEKCLSKAMAHRDSAKTLLRHSRKEFNRSFVNPLRRKRLPAPETMVLV